MNNGNSTNGNESNMEGAKLLQEIVKVSSILELEIDTLGKKITGYGLRLDLLHKDLRGEVVRLSRKYCAPQKAKEISAFSRGNQIKQILDEYGNGRRNIKARQQIDRGQRETLRWALSEVTKEVNSHYNEEKSIRQQVGRELGGDINYSSLHQKSEEASWRMETCKDLAPKIERTARELNNKHQKDILLHHVQLREKARDSILRRILTKPDKWLAKKVNMEQSEERRESLDLIPQAIKEKTTYYQEELNDLREQIASIEKEVEEEKGRPAIRAKIMDSVSSREDFINSMAGMNKHFYQSRGELNKLNETVSSSYLKATKEAKCQIITYLETLKLFIKSGGDKQAYRKIQEKLKDLAEAEKEWERASIREKVTQMRLSNLYYLEHKFCQKNYDLQESYFDAFDFNQLAAGFLQGNIQMEEILTQIRDNQSFAVEPLETLYGGSPFSSFSSLDSAHQHEEDQVTELDVEEIEIIS